MIDSYSQIGQDVYYIEHISKFKRNGFFLDIGANDGILTSNTAKLEFEYNWNGICIEANPDLIEVLTKNRPCSKIIHAAVWQENKTVQFEIPITDIKKTKGNLLSRISNIERNSKGFKKDTKIKTVRVQAKPVTDIIKENLKPPYIIDYMSLDIEGAELEALKSIDFSLIDIKFMTVEHGDRPGYLEEIYDYLKPFGYKIHRVNRWDVEFEK
jgi:FkbM family methyltransferase